MSYYIVDPRQYEAKEILKSAVKDVLDRDLVLNDKLCWVIGDTDTGKFIAVCMNTLSEEMFMSLVDDDMLHPIEVSDDEDYDVLQDIERSMKRSFIAVMASIVAMFVITMVAVIV